jgi:hypothetical protein
MPSGKKIDWSQFDHLITTHLPSMTVEQFSHDVLTFYD